MAAKRDGSLFWLGKYLSLALTLPASVMAGYLVGSFAANHLQLPILRAAGIVLGMAGGMLQLFRELARDEKGK